jgi:drug/metabolite transporter (DMT)-like permease
MARLHGHTPIVFLVVACGLWGGATVLSKHLLVSVPPVTLLVVQLAASSFALWLIVAIGSSRTFDKRNLLPLILLGLLNPGLAYTFALFGLELIPAGVATLLWAAEPIMILALAGVILREPVTARLLTVMFIGALGVFLVSGLADAGVASTVALQGVYLMLGAVLCCAVYTVFSRKVGATVDPLLTAAIQQVAGLAWAMALLPLEIEVSVSTHLSALSSFTLAVAAASGLLYYAAAYWLYLSALKSVPAAVAGSFFNLIPVVGVVLALVFLGERLTALQWIGAGAIMSSVFLLLRSSGRNLPAARSREADATATNGRGSRAEGR